MARSEKISFSFGENWKSYASTITDDDVRSAQEDILFWAGEESTRGKDVLDLGCGSGIHSLALFKLGARRLVSFDYDSASVEATNSVRKKADDPENWSVLQGSILDQEFLNSLGQFDLVYSWGVLHHTGSMWEAIDNAASLVKENGRLFFSIYKKGDSYERDLSLKKAYNAASKFQKWFMVRRKILGVMKRRLRSGKNPFAWNQKKARGMNVYHDIIDWLGGLPYEVATEDETIRHLSSQGFLLERIGPQPEGSCPVYVFLNKRNQLMVEK